MKKYEKNYFLGLIMGQEKSEYFFSKQHPF